MDTNKFKTESKGLEFVHISAFSVIRWAAAQQQENKPIYIEIILFVLIIKFYISIRETSDS